MKIGSRMDADGRKDRLAAGCLRMQPAGVV